MNGRTLIKTLSSSSLYHNFAQAYTDGMGLPLALRPVQTWQLPLHGRPMENRFCALLASKSRTCAGCLKVQERLSCGAMLQPCTVTCLYGLSETAVPVRLGSETLGLLQTGQVFQREPSHTHFAHVADHLQSLDAEMDPQALKEAYFATPVMSQHRMHSVSGLLSIFADHLSLRSNQIAVQQANAELPEIRRAKEFIFDHHRDPLSLDQVAGAVHMSIFHFCKLFRQDTGIPFTEFVSRTRIERAKNLLLNPNLRVSEVAYQVGFRSLTNFNRMFKMIVGESPTDYRIHLPAPRTQRRVLPRTGHRGLRAHARPATLCFSAGRSPKTPGDHAA